MSLTYPGSTKPALSDISLEFPRTGIVAIVGRNGSGKSSLLRILLGIRRDYAGLVDIGGHDLEHFAPRALRRQFGVVDQDTVLFSGTIRENLTTQEKVDTETLRTALSFSGALDFVEALPDGLDAKIGDAGRSLSGGQRQRLAIARATVREPKVALLDEPTAFLDAEAAALLEKRLTTWEKDRLVILVTHHLASIRNCGRIIMLDKGRVIGDGPHQRLMADVPEYASLWAEYARSL